MNSPWIQNSIKTLSSCGISDASREIFIILSHILKISPGEAEARLLSNRIDGAVISRAEYFLKIRCETRKPLAYILKKCEFFGLEFYIDENVLVPRPETEMLVEATLSNLPDERLVGVDVGTGSGAVAISLLKNRKNWTIFGTDISRPALDVAMRNAKIHDVAERFIPLQCDMLQPIKSIDFIVSNPPYIPSGEIFSLSAEVLNEPRIALDGGKDGLHFIKKLIEQSTVLSRRLVALEFGYGQREKIEMILKKNKIREAKFIKDMAGIQRVCVFSPQLF